FILLFSFSLNGKPLQKLPEVTATKQLTGKFHKTLASTSTASFTKDLDFFRDWNKKLNPNAVTNKLLTDAHADLKLSNKADLKTAPNFQEQVMPNDSQDSSPDDSWGLFEFLILI